MEKRKRNRVSKDSNKSATDRVYSSDNRSSSHKNTDNRFSPRKSTENQFRPRKKTFTEKSELNLESLQKSGEFKKDKKPGKFEETNLIRLNRYVASSGICSRRQADEYIAAGMVSVNDKVITEMGVKVKPSDIVKYNGEKIRSEKKVYILLNKPKDYVTTSDDPEGRRTVMELVKDAGKERIYPVGRLDRNTTGVLLFTNDGETASKLTHPKFNQKKIYHIFLETAMKQADFKKLAGGIELEDGFVKPDGLSFVNPDSKTELGIEIHSGKNRIVRRLFEALDYKVVKLDRVYFAGLTKKNLPRGRWRYLDDKEINLIKMNRLG